MKFYENIEVLSTKNLNQIHIYLGLEDGTSKNRQELLEFLFGFDFNSLLVYDIDTILDIMNINTKGSKNDKIDRILFYKYDLIKQLGSEGKEGKTYLVNHKHFGNCALKKFRNNIHSNSIHQEAYFLQEASKQHISPKILDLNLEKKYIVMEIMDELLYDRLCKTEGIFTNKDQERLIDIYTNLDKVGIFHADSNILNYMYKDDTLYIIDFGMSKKIDKDLIKELNTTKPNMELMLLGFILKLKELNCPKTSYEILLRYLPSTIKDNMGL